MTPDRWNIPKKEIEAMTDKNDLYYINKRIDTVESNIKTDLSRVEATIRSDIEEIKAMFFSHLDMCEEKMCKMDEIHNKKIEQVLESREIKLCKVDDKLISLDKKYEDRIKPLENFKTQVIILVIAVGTVLELYNIFT